MTAGRKFVIGEQEHREIAVFSMLYPPAGEVGALRVGKLTQWLRDSHGWSMVVAKREGGLPTHSSPGLQVISVPAYDSLAAIRWLRSKQKTTHGQSTGVDVAVPSKAGLESPLSKRSLLARLSDLLVVPDSRQSWAWGAYRRMKPLVKSHSVKAILSSGPPHSAHLAAYLCKRKFGLPWVIDLRDPWCANPYEQPLSDLAKGLNYNLERRCFNLADAILANTEPARQLILERYPDMAQEKVVTLPNGIDEEDYANLKPKPFWTSSHRPVMVHAGSLYSKRNPKQLFHALGIVKRQGGLLPRFLFVGTVDASVDASIRGVIQAEGLSDDVEFLAPLSRGDCLQGMLAADGLLLIGDAEPIQLQIPAKLFEYLYLQKPILSLFPSNSPVNNYLNEYAPCAACASPAQLMEIVDALTKLNNFFDASKPSKPNRPVQELFRSSQAQVLNDLLERLIGNQSHAVSMKADAGSNQR